MLKLRNMTGIYLWQNGRVLLLHRHGSRVVDGKWTGAAGGHFEMEELNDPAACVLRELKEELGLDAARLQGLALRYITLRRTQGEVRQNYYFFAELTGDTAGLTSNEGDLRWFLPEETAALPMPYSARFMFDHYLHTGRYTTALYGGVTTGSGMVITEMEP